MGSRDEADAILARYAWAEAEERLVEALSITLVQPADGSAIAALRASRELPGPLTVAQALDETLRLADFAWGSVLA